jgi:hypothetical protein
MPKATKQRKQNDHRAPASKKPDGERRHNSPHAGKILVKLAKDNPRREGTAGYESWKLLKPRMKYEDAVNAGVRPVDIRWDIEHGHLKVVSK